MRRWRRRWRRRRKWDLVKPEAYHLLFLGGIDTADVADRIHHSALFCWQHWLFSRISGFF
jgi:hypothetical protein